MTLLYMHLPKGYFFAYAVFFSALIVTIRSDLETMLISRFVTLVLAPVGWLLSWLGYLPITLEESLIGTLAGYGFLYLISHGFTWIKGKDGMGQGDVELLAFIGSFIGATGCWISMLVGSLTGSLIGLSYLVMTKQSSSVKIPFGPFLAFGAIIYVFFQQTFMQLLLYQ